MIGMRKSCFYGLLLCFPLWLFIIYSIYLCLLPSVLKLITQEFQVTDKLWIEKLLNLLFNPCSMVPPFSVLETEFRVSVILYQCSHLYNFWPFNKMSWSLPIIRSYLVIFSYWFPKMSLIIPLIVHVPHLTLDTTCKEKLKNDKMVVMSRWRYFSLARVHPVDKLLLLLLDPVLKVSNSRSKIKISF